MPRALLVTVIPLEAHALLGDAQKVSLLYFGVSIMGLSGSMGIPWLVHKVRRRRVFTLAALCLAIAPLVMSLQTLPGLIGGLALYTMSVAGIEVTLSLYLMDHIARRDLGRFEPIRLFYAAGAWTLGPWLGVFLKNQIGHIVPFAMAGVLALALLTLFWVLRLTENPAVAPAKGPPPSPLTYLPRFFGQPRLRLAWLLAVGRSGWWGMFFIYAPIYVVTAGLSENVGGAIISIGAAALFAVPLWGWFGQRYGLRSLLVWGYTLSGLGSIAIATAAGVPWLGAAILVGAALTTGMVDGAGNVPFLRAVHPIERPEMTTVFATYRDAAQLGPPGVFSMLLQFFALPAVFVASGFGMLVLSYYARFIPRRL